jgi:hypothetical protein
MRFKFFRGGIYPTDDFLVFQAAMLPMVRRIRPNIINNDLVSVQPMNEPRGILYYMDFVMNNNKIKESTFKFFKKNITI